MKDEQKETIVRIEPLPDEYIEESRAIAVMNEKGGCAKTGLCDALGHRLVDIGYNVLLIDLDQQCNLSQKEGLSDDSQYSDRRINRFFQELGSSNRSKNLSLPICIDYDEDKPDAPKLCLLAGHQESVIDAIAAQSKNERQFFNIFRDRINFYQRYFNYIIIDTAPAMYNNVLNRLAVAASDEIIIPIDGLEAVTGLKHFMHWVNDELYKDPERKHKPNATFAMLKYQRDTVNIQIKGLHTAVHIPNKEMFDSKQALNRYVSSLVTDNSVHRIMKEVLGDYVCDRGIPERRILRNSTYTSCRRELKFLYNDLCDEIISKISKPRTNVFELWDQNLLAEYLEKMLLPIEEGIHNDKIPRLSPVRFDQIRQVKANLKKGESLKKEEDLNEAENLKKEEDLTETVSLPESVFNEQ